MRTLTPVERRQLRAKAHPLHPVVTIGHHGLTPAVLHEIDVNLLAHELIKIRVFSDERDAREALLERICGELDCALVQHLGKILTVWRPAPEPEAPVDPPRAAKRGFVRKPARPTPRDAGPRSRSTTAAPRAKAGAEPVAPDARRRKPRPQGGAAATFDGSPAGRRRKPGPQGGRSATFGADTAARRRKPGPQGGRTATGGAEPAARKHKPRVRGGRTATFEGHAAGGRGRARAAPAAPAPGARRRRTPR